MSNTAEIQAMFDHLETQYQYDTSYMQKMNRELPEGFQRFRDFLPMAQFRQELSVEVHFVAKLAAFQEADCGACLQLNVKMAIEAGVEKHLIEKVLEQKDLPAEFSKVNQLARDVINHRTPDPAVIESLRQALGESGLNELGLAIASVGVFPAIKRTLGMIQQCQVISISA